jgi:hypothetical protein
MEVPVENVSWLSRPSLEIVVIVSLAYRGSPLSTKVSVGSPEQRSEALSLFREMKGLIEDYRDSGPKQGLKAKIRGGEVRWDSSVELVDLLPMARGKAKNGPGWQRLYHFCEEWQAELPRSDKAKRRRNPVTEDPREVIVQLDRVRDQVRKWYPSGIPERKRAECARKLELVRPKLGWWQFQTFKKMLGGKYGPANRMVDEHDYVPWWPA